MTNSLVHYTTQSSLCSHSPCVAHDRIMTVGKKNPHAERERDAESRGRKCRTGCFCFRVSASLFVFRCLPSGSETVVHTGWSTFSPRPVSKNLPYPRSGHILTHAPNQAHKQMSGIHSARKRHHLRGRQGGGLLMSSTTRTFHVDQSPQNPKRPFPLCVCARVCACVCLGERCLIVSEFMKFSKGTLTTMDCK